jgi:hypothetical protein
LVFRYTMQLLGIIVISGVSVNDGMWFEMCVVDIDICEYGELI